MKPEHSAEVLDAVVREMYADQSPAMKKKYGDPPARVIGVDFSPLRAAAHEEECAANRESSIRRNYHPHGCGHRMVIRWAGASIARCGAELNSFGKITRLKCQECGGNDGWREQSII